MATPGYKRLSPPAIMEMACLQGKPNTSTHLESYKPTDSHSCECW